MPVSRRFTNFMAEQQAFNDFLFLLELVEMEEEQANDEGVLSSPRRTHGRYPKFEHRGFQFDNKATR